MQLHYLDEIAGHQRARAEIERGRAADRAAAAERAAAAAAEAEPVYRNPARM